MNRSPSVEKCLFPADTTVVTSSILTSKNDKGKEFPPPPVPLSVEVSFVNGGNGERIVLHDRQQILEKEGEDGQKFLRVSARLGLVNPCGKALYLSTVIFNLRVPFFFLFYHFLFATFRF